MYDVHQLVDHLFRREAGKMVSILTRIFGLHNVELVEDIVQDTHHQALCDWTCGPLPDNPGGWLMTVAKRKAINAIKRERTVRSFAGDMDALLKSEWTAAYTMDNVFLETEVRDSQLRMIFTCCHPALSPEAQVALTLKTLCGFGVAEIASALLTSEANVNKRLYRAREKFRSGGIDFTVPSGQALFERLDAVLLVIYLLFNEGYHSSGSNLAIRKDLCLEAMRLGMLLMDKPSLKGYPQTPALMALMCFHTARFEARDEGLVLLEEQDRSRWDQDLIVEGLRFLSESAGGSHVTEYHLEAAIAAEHCLAPRFCDTNWRKIYDYYIALLRIKPSPVIRLNLAVISSMTEGLQAAIAQLHALEADGSLSAYPLLYASLGEFYFQCGDNETALAYFERSITFTRVPATIEVLERKASACRR
ncbi:RNA polymerase sigma factor [Dinghuibacter silviterrae]|uniref:RNA polymerase sigma-70 factor (ECF subfamily) n=1 Tax=Dinghuibacter silviterrae TaxID=1539049 RepID=A0A4V3GKT9_9BACT|nr:sigma-70 family RNA polymerase sigma factor [Dinghuibacter silviterrae]TDW96922.1 RNA polymerase sigma-70 factor (ECF subfamily) [Dinghuibacter silviterrae]